jgi:catechol O-methyltransferase
VLIGSLLSPGARFLSVEINATFAAIATKIVEFAGLADRVQVRVGAVADVLPSLASELGAGSVDLVFVDHWKDRYLPDLLNLQASGLLRVGSVLVGDNIIFPGAPDYLRYVQEGAAACYDTELVETELEYSRGVRDAVAISRVKSTAWPAAAAAPSGGAGK